MVGLFIVRAAPNTHFLITGRPAAGACASVTRVNKHAHPRLVHQNALENISDGSASSRFGHQGETAGVHLPLSSRN